VAAADHYYVIIVCECHIGTIVVRGCGVRKSVGLRGHCWGFLNREWMRIFAKEDGWGGAVLSGCVLSWLLICLGGMLAGGWGLVMIASLACERELGLENGLSKV
jgi:hypothetical protein